jgi:hypothetical protein
LPRELPLGSHQAPISMGFGARLPGTKLTLLSRFSATRGAPHRQCLFFGDSHGYRMRVFLAGRWSILTTQFSFSFRDGRCNAPRFPTKSPYATLYTGGSDGFVTSATAPIATGWSDPVLGGNFKPRWTKRFSRRAVNEMLRQRSRTHRSTGNKMRNQVVLRALGSEMWEDYRSCRSLRKQGRKRAACTIGTNPCGHRP